MRRFLDKWGTAIAAVACALTIVFAAVYTRQDDLKRIAAQEARAAQDQSLQDAQAETVWARPVPSAPSEGFRGAYRDEHGLWRMQPYTRYPAAYGQSVTAVCAGEVLTVSADSLTYRCAGGETITCAGLSAALRAARGHGRAGCGNYASSAKRGGIFGLGKPALPII